MNDKEHYSGDDDPRDKITSIDELIEHIMEMFTNSVNQNADKSVIHGFTIISQPGKEPKIFSFKGQKEPESFEHEDEREGDFYIFNQEPFIDVFETEDKVILLADLGVEENQIEYYPYESNVELTVITKGTGYSKVVSLPCNVDPDSMVTNYKNGILELVFQRAADEE